MGWPLAYYVIVASLQSQWSPQSHKAAAFARSCVGRALVDVNVNVNVDVDVDVDLGYRYLMLESCSFLQPQISTFFCFCLYRGDNIITDPRCSVIPAIAFTV